MRFFLLALSLCLIASVTWAEQPEHVGSKVCGTCHEAQAKSWATSHHALAWTQPNAQTVVADFDGTVFEHDGMTARFSLEAGRYRVRITEKDGATTDYAVHSVAGIAPLQQFVLETEPGRLQSLDVVWNSESGGWFHLYPEQDLPPDDALHWRGPYKNWNGRCAQCHATGYDKGYDAALRQYQSTQAEIGVGCEACHGPGEAHLAWARNGQYDNDDVALDAYGFSQAFASTEATMQECAGCHSRREAFEATSPVPGTPYHNAYNLALLRPGLYFADGQIRDEVYVYGSFLQSKMYARGVGCLDCHDAHSGGLVLEGNAVCTQCHNPVGNPRFPELKKAHYDTFEHHFHPPDSAAAQCTACHAPERVYMGNDWRADHSFRVPRPDLAARIEAPDACTTCHSDQSPDWAAAELAARFPDSVHRGPHYGELFDRARRDPSSALIDLTHLAAETTQPAIVRATALSLLAPVDNAAVAERVAPLLHDPHPLVRAHAAALQRAAPASVRIERLQETLDDDTRLVRMETARALLDMAAVHLPLALRPRVERAMREWRATYSSRLDFPETHLQLGGLALSMRSIPGAVAAFREVVRLDPQQSDAWIMLVRIAAATEGRATARTVLQQAQAALPEHPVLRQLQAELNATE